MREKTAAVTSSEAWFDRLYAEYRRYVHAYCARRIPASEVDDAVSEVFAVAWRRRAEVPAHGATLPWLYGVARRVLSTQRRSSVRFSRLRSRIAAIPDPPPIHPDAVVVQRQEHADVRRAVAQLRPADREVLLLAAWEELSHKEIAEVLECSVAAVTKRFARAKERLATQYRHQLSPSSHRPPASTSEGGGGR